LEKAMILHIWQQKTGPWLGNVCLTTRIKQFLENVGKGNGFACVAEAFPTGTYGVSRALPRKIGMGPAGEAQEKRESRRYHEWERRSQQRTQCAPTAATKGTGTAQSTCQNKTKWILPVHGSSGLISRHAILE